MFAARLGGILLIAGSVLVVLLIPLHVGGRGPVGIGSDGLAGDLEAFCLAFLGAGLGIIGARPRGLDLSGLARVGLVVEALSLVALAPGGPGPDPSNPNALLVPLVAGLALSLVGLPAMAIGLLRSNGRLRISGALMAIGCLGLLTLVFLRAGAGPGGVNLVPLIGFPLGVLALGLIALGGRGAPDLASNPSSVEVA